MSGEGSDAATLAEQNVKLRAALKRLQELSSQEKAELLRRQRDLERETAQVGARAEMELGGGGCVCLCCGGSGYCGKLLSMMDVSMPMPFQCVR